MSESAIVREDLASVLRLESSKRFSFGRWMWRFVSLLVVVALGLLGYARLGSQATRIQYITKPAEQGDLIVSVIATGTLEPTNQVDVGSELSGIVRVVNVDYNDTVEHDQVLAVLDTSKFESQVAQSQAALHLAEAELLSAIATLKEQAFEVDHIKRLTDSSLSNELERVATHAAHERAVAAEKAARAKVDQAQASLDAAQTELAKTVIRSPVNGVVLTRSVEPGQTVAASLQAPVLFTLAEDLAQMELQVDIDEADISQIDEGQVATFTVDSFPQRSFDARITQVRFGPESTSGVVTYKAVLLVDNQDLLLRPGMTATASITVKQVTSALLVPNAALQYTPADSDSSQSSGGLASMLIPRPPRPPQSKKAENDSSDDDQHRVWVLEHKQPVAINVTAGESDGSRTAVIAEGLTPGMELIVDAAKVKQ